MKAVIRTRYGGPEVLNYQEVDAPQAADHQIVVRVRALSINPAEWHILRGSIWLVRAMNGLWRPKHRILGGDVAGEVVAVGRKVAAFQPGDRVFGRAEHSALAEYALLDASKAAQLPRNVGFEAGASLPLAATTALVALKRGAPFGMESKVLIHGASGGIGTLAIQMAKAQGATVHAVCSSPNTELVQRLGADRVINYDCSAVFHPEHRYDHVVDLVGNLPVRETVNHLKEGGTFVKVGYSDFGEMFRFIRHSLRKPRGVQLATIDAKVTMERLNEVAVAVATGGLQPVVDQVFDFHAIPEAFAYLGTRRARGKVVIRLPEVAHTGH